MAADPGLEALLEANRTFYEAFEQRDIDVMSSLWEHSERVICTHPGWSALRGWGAVSASWFALFQGPAPLQFILTEVRAHVSGPVGWVCLDENLISEELGATVSALNLFVLTDEGWRMVAHHASAVAPH
jgi:hypothetical protein